MLMTNTHRYPHPSTHHWPPETTPLQGHIVIDIRHLPCQPQNVFVLPAELNILRVHPWCLLSIAYCPGFNCRVGPRYCNLGKLVFRAGSPLLTHGLLPPGCNLTKFILSVLGRRQSNQRPRGLTPVPALISSNVCSFVARHGQPAPTSKQTPSPIHSCIESNLTVGSSTPRGTAPEHYNRQRKKDRIQIVIDPSATSNERRIVRGRS